MEIQGIHNVVKVGGFSSNRVVSTVITARRHHPLSQAIVVLSDPVGEVAGGVSLKDPVNIIYGHRGGQLAEWSGSVTAFGCHNKDQIEISCVGLEKPLTATRITQAWLKETPENVIAYAVKQAGLAVGRINAPGPLFPHFITSNHTPWEIAKSCARTCEQQFGIDMRRWAFWMDSAGLVNWGDFEDQSSPQPVVATGAGLVEHKTGDGPLAESRVETFLLPGFWHSQPFVLQDNRRNINGTFRTLAVEHLISGAKARTYICKGDEYGQF